MSELIKIAILGILGVMVALQFRATRPEYGIYMGLVISVLIFTYAVRQFSAVLGQFTLIRQFLGSSQNYLSILLKITGVTYICEFSAGICKDAGYGAVAEQIEILGKLSVMFAGLPVLLVWNRYRLLCADRFLCREPAVLRGWLMEGLSMDLIWEEYGLDQLQQGLSNLFPGNEFSLRQVLAQIMQGDVLGAIRDIANAMLGDMGSQLAGLRNVLLWLVMLGMVSALMSHFMEIFDKHQVADISFYFMYLLLTAVLLASFGRIAQVASTTMENILLFIRLLVPTYLMAVGVASGTATAGASYQLVLLLIYGVERVLIGGLLPFIYSYVLLAVVNGIWIEEKLSMLMELLEKGIKAALKAIIGIVTGISVFQSVITPVIDTVKTSAMQKIMAAVPGIGGAADSLASMVIGSAVVIKNSIGVVLLILLMSVCLSPLLQILLTACCMKLAAAVMGIISDKRITACTNKVGEGSMMLLKITGTALLLFLISISLVAVSTNHGL